MWSQIKNSLIYLILLFFGCSTEEEPPGLTGNSISYFIYEYETMDRVGDITFFEREDVTYDYKIEFDQNQNANLSAILISGSGVEEGAELANLGTIDGAVFEDKIAKNILPVFEDLSDLSISLLLKNVTGDISFFAEIGSNQLSGEILTYSIHEVNNSGNTAVVNIYKRLNDGILVYAKMLNTKAGDMHPIHIHRGTVIMGGPIEIDFKPINGASGISYTDVKKNRLGEEVLFWDMSNYDGYITIHKSAQELTLFLAQGNIGRNVFTGNELSYELSSITSHLVSGEALFKERVSGAILFVIQINKTDLPSPLPIHIHENTATESGAIIFPLNNVNNTTGIGITEIPAKSNGGPFSFEELSNIDAYLNLHLSESQIQVFVAQCDIGGNVLTGDKINFTLEEYKGSGVEGAITISKRKNGNSFIEMQLSNTIPGILHPTHFHSNSAAEAGGIIINLKNVNGDTGYGGSNVEIFNDGTKISYDELILLDGHIVVHKSPTELPIKITIGDIGINVVKDTQVSYLINEMNSSGVSGNAVFFERESGYSKLKISIEGPLSGTYTAGIYNGANATSGEKLFSLINIESAFQESTSHIETDLSGNLNTYLELLTIDAHIRIYDANQVLVGIALIGANN